MKDIMLAPILLSTPPKARTPLFKPEKAVFPKEPIALKPPVKASRIGAFFADLKVNGEPVLDFIAGTALPAIVDGALNLVDRLADLGPALSA